MTTGHTELVVAKFDYKATDSHELGIQKGEKLTLVDDSQHWWKVMNAQGATGYVPSNYVKRSKQGIFYSLRNTLGRKKSRASDTDNSQTASRHHHHQSIDSFNDKFNNLNVSTGGGLHKTADSSQELFSNQPYKQSPYNSPTSQIVNGLHQPNTEMQQIPMDGSHQRLPPTSSSLHLRHATSFTDSYNVPFSQGWNVKPNGNENTAPYVTPAGSNGTPLFRNTVGINSHVCQALFAYPATQPDELTIERGDQIRVLEKSSDGWWRGVLLTEGKPSLTGWFPSNYVTLDFAKNIDRSMSCAQSRTKYNINTPDANRTNVTNAMLYPDCTNVPNTNHTYISLNEHQIPNPNPIISQVDHVSQSTNQNRNMFTTRETVLTLYPFARNQVEEMSFNKDEVLEVLNKPPDDPDWWRCRNARGEVGLVPRNYLRTLYTPAPSLSHMARPHGYDPQNGDKVEQVRVTNKAAAVAANAGEDLRLNFAMRSNWARSHIKQPWYWGAISRADCEVMLGQHANPGEFIVRDSESHPGDLTITISTGTKTRNFKIHLESNQYQIGQKVFPTIGDLIDHYQTHPIFKCDQEKHYLVRSFVHPGPVSCDRPVIGGGSIPPSMTVGGLPLLE